VLQGSFGTSAGYDYVTPNGNGAASTGGSYTVQDGDSLQSIAQNVWGDASLWYLIAQANGLSAGTALIQGQSVSLPDRVSNVHNSAATFKVYDPAKAMGELSPTSAKPGKSHGSNTCGVIGMIMLVMIAVAVTVITSGAALAALSPAVGSIGAGITAMATGAAVGGVSISAGALVAAGAIGGAVGSIVSQGVGVATVLQDKFSWKQVAMSGLAGGIGAGIGASGAFSGLSPLLRGAAIGATSSALSQGVGVATGLQDRFSWTAVAAAGIGGGVSSAAGKSFGASSLADRSLRNIGANLGTSAAGALANAGARTLINGSDFGDNLMAALPDVIGGTLGNIFAGTAESLGLHGRGGSQDKVGYDDGQNKNADASKSPTESTSSSEELLQASGNGTFTARGSTRQTLFTAEGTGRFTDEILASSADPAFLDDMARQVGPEAIVAALLMESDRTGKDGPVSLQQISDILYSQNVQEYSYNHRDLSLMIDEFTLKTSGFLYRTNDPSHPNNYDVHIVAAGENITTISSSRTYLTTSDIVSINDIADPDHISIGQKLRVPSQEFLNSRAAHDENYQRYVNYIARTGGYSDTAYADIPPISLEEAAVGIRRYNNESPVARIFGDVVAQHATRRSGMADRVVLGVYEGQQGGYIAEARDNGGIWYEVPGGVHQIMTEGLSGRARSNKEWVPNEAFIRQQLEAGVGRFDFTGNWKDRVTSAPTSGLGREYRYLQNNAPRYGYYWNGASWIKR